MGSAPCINTPQRVQKGSIAFVATLHTSTINLTSCVDVTRTTMNEKQENKKKNRRKKEEEGGEEERRGRKWG